MESLQTLHHKIVKLWPLIYRFQLILDHGFLVFFGSYETSYWLYSCFWKSLTSIFDPMEDLGPKWAPQIWQYRSVPRNYVSFRRVISIEKPSWTPFPTAGPSKEENKNRTNILPAHSILKLVSTTDSSVRISFTVWF